MISIRTSTRTWVTLFVVFTIIASGLLQITNVKPALASYSDTYPWSGAPCAASGANLGNTTGTGYWCSGYNWGVKPCPTGDGYCTSSWLMNTYYLLDQWGEGFRNCVSYTAWQANQMFNINPTNWGNGKDWNNSAIAAGYSNDTSPRVGDIAQWDATTQNVYGHVAYVYAVNNGVASYAEYNYGQDGAYLDTYTSASNPQGTPTPWIHLGTPSNSNTGDADPDHGSSSTINVGGQVQAYYYDATNGNLRHSWTDSSGWHFENLDGDTGSVAHFNGDVGKYVSAAVLGTSIHVFYYDGTYGNLRHAWTSTGGWNFESLEGDATSVSHHDANVGLDINVIGDGSQLQLFYYDTSYGNLRHTWWTATSGWVFDALDGDTNSTSQQAGNVGRYPSAGFVGGQIQVLYYDVTNGNVRRAWTTSGTWNFQTLEGDTGSVSGWNSNLGAYISLLPVGSYLHAFYYDASYGNLRHSWTDAGGWHFENLDGESGQH
jgi:surface antigen